MRALPLIWYIRPNDITKTFEAPEQLVHGLLAHAGALGERAWANAIRPRKLQYRQMRNAQSVKTGGVKLVDETAMDRLSRNAQQGADEYILGFDRWLFWRRRH